MARDALEWQAELGVSDAIGDTPIDRYRMPTEKPQPIVIPVVSSPATMAPVALDPIVIAVVAGCKTRRLVVDWPRTPRVWRHQ